MRYYIESDGRVFLVRRDERLDLPFPSEISFAVERIAPLAGTEDVWFCVPMLDRHPTEWPCKDELALLATTDLARIAVHATMPRVVVEGVCIRDGEVLVVKGSRGLTEGRWSLPGGFLRFGETPAEGVLREIQEEVGLVGAIEEAPVFRSKIGEESRLHWIMIFYRVAVDGVPIPSPDEIAEARFVEPKAASEMLDATLGSVVLELADR